jgi:hypothetical protein
MVEKLDLFGAGLLGPLACRPCRRLPTSAMEERALRLTSSAALLLGGLSGNAASAGSVVAHASSARRDTWSRGSAVSAADALCTAEAAIRTAGPLDRGAATAARPLHDVLPSMACPM